MRLAFLLALPLLTGCALGPSCGGARRELTAVARVSPPQGLDPRQVFVNVMQIRDSRQVLLIGWSLGDPDLQPHVRAVSIVTGGTGSLIADLPQSDLEGRADIGGTMNLTLGDSDAADRVYDMIVGNETAVVIATDIPGSERIVRALEYEGGTDWYTPSCD
jgi:hypothetical protein